MSPVSEIPKFYHTVLKRTKGLPHDLTVSEAEVIYKRLFVTTNQSLPVCSKSGVTHWWKGPRKYIQVFNAGIIGYSPHVRDKLMVNTLRIPLEDRSPRPGYITTLKWFRTIITMIGEDAVSEGMRLRNVVQLQSYLNAMDKDDPLYASYRLSMIRYWAVVLATPHQPYVFLRKEGDTLDPYAFSYNLLEWVG